MVVGTSAICLAANKYFCILCRIPCSSIYLFSFLNMKILQYIPIFARLASNTVINIALGILYIVIIPISFYLKRNDDSKWKEYDCSNDITKPW